MKALYATLFLMVSISLISGCSDESASAKNTSQLSQEELSAAPKEELAMPLNTPISAVKAGEEDASTSESADSEFEEIDWDDLMPKDYRIEELLAEINAGNISDDDPRIDEAMAKVKDLFAKAPIVEDLNNKMIKLPGFVVPLDPDNEKMNDFLLVPYYGACIHVPPPPANQTVFVTGKQSKFELYDTVWVKGKIMIERSENELGDSGYSIQATSVEPYE